MGEMIKFNHDPETVSETPVNQEQLNIPDKSIIVPIKDSPDFQIEKKEMEFEMEVERVIDLKIVKLTVVHSQYVGSISRALDIIKKSGVGQEIIIKVEEGEREEAENFKEIFTLVGEYKNEVLGAIKSGVAEGLPIDESALTKVTEIINSNIGLLIDNHCSYLLSNAGQIDLRSHIFKSSGNKPNPRNPVSLFR